MRVDVEIYEDEIESDSGHPTPGLHLTCARCGHEVAVFGTGESSAKRGAYILRQECPNGESNFYDVNHWNG